MVLHSINYLCVCICFGSFLSLVIQQFMSSGQAPSDGVTTASVAQAKDQYMETFSRLFEEEIVEAYESDVNGEAVKHLRSCIEAGVAVWGFPLVMRDPTIL